MKAIGTITIARMPIASQCLRNASQDRPVALRGFSWIVNPYDEGGVVIALEMSLGAIVAGPFNIAERDLTAMIQNVMAAEGKASHSAEMKASARRGRETIH